MNVQSISPEILEASTVPVEAMARRESKRGSLNLCSGCNRNFAGAKAHELHRTGKFGVDRRCMTPSEMRVKGFTMAVEPIRRCREGQDYTEEMETWHEPVSDKQRAGLQRMKGRVQ